MDVPVYIRFGVHKDRVVLKEARENFKGIVVPAHILAHSSDATRVAIDYIDRPFFIDPMTYIFTRENIRSYLTKDSEDKEKFKMSIEKMADEYGILQYFIQRNYKAIDATDFDNDEFLSGFCEKSIAFQKGKVNDQAETAFKKYSKILSELNLSDMKSTDHQPLFYTPPYFYFKKVDDEWHKANIKLAKKVLSFEGMNKDNVAPIILTNSTNLTAALLDAYSEFTNILIWISDLDESSPNDSPAQITKLSTYANFIRLAKERNVKVTNLYGSYFSGILTKLGLEAFSNGIFYGEYKSYSSKIGGGAPPVRFYISKLHHFYLVPTTLAIFNEAPELFNFEPDETKALLKNNRNNVAEMLDKKKHSMAQKHFLWARKQELSALGPFNLTQIITILISNYKKYEAIVSSIHTDPPLHLNAWATALQVGPDANLTES